MPETKPFFSICIPAHNPLPLLEAAIDSITAQSFESWEAIIVDDCSQYEVGALLNERAKKHQDKISVIRLSENKGPLYARRVAFKAAQGLYILCLDADDEFNGTDMLSRLHAALVSSCELPDVAMFNATTSRVGLELWVNYKSLGIDSSSPSNKEVIEAFLGSYSLNNLCLKAIKRDLLLSYGFDTVDGLRMCEDRYEVAGVFSGATSYLLIDEPFYFYRQNPKSTTHRLFELDYCRQQSFVEKAIAKKFSESYSLNSLFRQMLRVWADDMCLITQGRNLDEAANLYRVMARDSFFSASLEAAGIRGQRLDRKILISLLHGGHYSSAAIAAKMISTARRILKNRKP